METLVLNTEQVAETTPFSAVIDHVRTAFAAFATGNAVMPAKSYIDLPHYEGDFRSMPSYVSTPDWDAAGVKWVNSHPNNPRNHDLPTVMGVFIYSDPKTARPLAIMDGTELTRKRTGAAAAIATDVLAISEATSLGIVGAGAQSYDQVEAIGTVRQLETIVIVDNNPDRISEFIDTFGGTYDVREGTYAEAASCDILSTVTPVREPIISQDMVGDHTHINAMGADAAGKQELDSSILQDAKLVIDNYEQCTHSGEINVPWANGELTDDDLHGELGAVLINELPGRTTADGVTVFDSTGLSIQDVAAANVAYQHAKERDIGTVLSLISAT